MSIFDSTPAYLYHASGLPAEDLGPAIEREFGVDEDVAYEAWLADQAEPTAEQRLNALFAGVEARDAAMRELFDADLARLASK